MQTPRIGIIIGTIGEGRFGDTPARWIDALGAARHDLTFEIVDLRDYRMPLFGDPGATGRVNDSIQRWRKKLDSLDGYIFITAEYNHGISSVLKNALDHAYSEYNRKPASFIGYGGVGGARAVEQLRLIAIELRIAPLRSAVHIGMDAFVGAANGSRQLADYDFLTTSANAMLDELSWWTHTLRAGRAPASASTATATVVT